LTHLRSHHRGDAAQVQKLCSFPHLKMKIWYHSIRTCMTVSIRNSSVLSVEVSTPIQSNYLVSMCSAASVWNLKWAESVNWLARSAVRNANNSIVIGMWLLISDSIGCLTYGRPCVIKII
jgi:hypothetical protein